MMMLEIGKTGDEQIVPETREIMALVSGLAAAVLPMVIEILKDRRDYRNNVKPRE